MHMYLLYMCMWYYTCACGIVHVVVHVVVHVHVHVIIPEVFEVLHKPQDICVFPLRDTMEGGMSEVLLHYLHVSVHTVVEQGRDWGRGSVGNVLVASFLQIEKITQCMWTYMYMYVHTCTWHMHMLWTCHMCMYMCMYIYMHHMIVRPIVSCTCMWHM